MEQMPALALEIRHGTVPVTIAQSSPAMAPQCRAPVGQFDGSNISGVNEFMGAKLGANVARRQATPGRVRRLSRQVSAMPGDAGRRGAMAGVCMACKRSGVRIPIAPPRSET